MGFYKPQAVSEEETDSAVRARLDRQRVLDDETKQFVLIMSEGALRWQAGSPALMAEQAEAIAAATKRPNMRFGIIPWTTPVDRFPIHGFHVYDEDAVIVGTLTATATITGTADIATYLEQFAALETFATFDDDARDHLARIRNEYRQLEES
jgi:hypothetical protein